MIQASKQDQKSCGITMQMNNEGNAKTDAIADVFVLVLTHGVGQGLPVVAVVAVD